MWIFKKKTRSTGALEDTRSVDAKQKDYFFNEIVASADPVNWVEKSPDYWRTFSVRDQDGSSSCVMQSIAKLAEVMYWVKSDFKEKIPFSAGFYKLRSNYPSEGMIGVDAFEIWRKNGIVLEQLLSSQNMNEAQLNTITVTSSDNDIAKVFKIDNYVQYQPKTSFDDVASTIQKTGKAVMVWFEFNYDEWMDIPVIKTTSPKLRHSVSATDYTLYNGKQYLVIDDSWGKFNAWNGKRLISREFYEKRNLFAAYPINFKNLEEEKPTKPKYMFYNDLSFGENHVDIQALQDILKYEGLFPTNVQSTGYYGAITAKHVLAWQKKYVIDHPYELDKLGGKIVGPKTRSKLNELYSH
jgi:hypothetical protein